MAERWNRRDFLTAAGVRVAMAAGRRVAWAAERVKRPNVVLVMTDDQGYGDLACHGNPVIRTPNLDRMHGRCVRLTDFHVSPLCTPTRAQLMTGQDAVRTGAWGTTWGRSLPRPGLPTIAEAFAAGGYRTGHFGKWHLGDNYPYRPEDRGFTEVLRHGGGGVGQTPDYWGNNYFDDTYCHNGTWKKHEGYCTDVWFDGALRFIEANRNRPFFCYIPTNAPHGPYLVADKYKNLYKGVAARSAAFYGMITNIDENMGRLDKALERWGLADNTIVIFTTDNGSSGGTFAAGLRGRKGSTYEGGHRVPCFIRWPAGRMVSGRDIDELTCCQDLVPTLIALCGLATPKGAQFDGVDISPLLTGRAKRLADRMLVTQYSQTTAPPPKWKAAVMQGRWRLVGQKELYDVRADPGQKKNVAADHPEVTARMRAHYEEWWADVSRRFDDISHIVLGNEAENPAHLNAFDWHARTPWNQGHVRGGARINSFWAVEIERDGTYEFALRRWPRELDKPLVSAGGGAGKALPIARAKINVGDVEKSTPVTPADTAATFTLTLKAGKTKLRATFLDQADKQICGAFYVSARRL